MKGFEDVTLTWGDESFIVSADRQMELILRIEDALCPTGGSPMQVLARPGGPGPARLACAYGAALRYAGADVTNDEIYLTIEEGFAEGDAEAAVKVQGLILGLIGIVSPPMASRLRPKAGKGDPAAGTTDGDSSEPSTT